MNKDYEISFTYIDAFFIIQNLLYFKHIHNKTHIVVFKLRLFDFNITIFTSYSHQLISHHSKYHYL